MPRARRFQVLVATDGSASARAALATAVRFPWPAETRGSAVVVKQVRADYRRSILLSALDRTSEVRQCPRRCGYRGVVTVEEPGLFASTSRELGDGDESKRAGLRR